MKNSLKNFLLWQKKRSELPVGDDPQVDWDQMQSLLDEHMPVKNSGGFKGFRTLPAILITFSAAAMIYLAGNIYHLEKRRSLNKHHFHNSNTKRQVPNVAASNFSSTKTHKDSLLSAGDGTKHHDSIGSGGKGVAGIVTPISSAGNSKDNHAAGAANTKESRSGSPANKTNLLAGDRQSNSQTSRVFAGNKAGQGGGKYAAYGNHRAMPGSGNISRANTMSQISRGVGIVNVHHPDQSTAAASAFNNRSQDGTLTPVLHAMLKVDLNLNTISKPPALPILKNPLNQPSNPAGAKTRGSKKDKSNAPQNTKPSNLDWGILMGVNTSGSFTPKSQNANFYGSAAIDPWFGLFASYKINNNWAIAPQVHFFSPQNIVTAYTHANRSKVDSAQSLSVTASRKMYAVSVPVYVVYNTGNGLNLKAGPVINFPLKQINTNSVLLPYSIRSDTTYYKSISATLNATNYQQSINFGFAAGVSYQFKRFIFEATYLKSLSGYGVSSGLGSYKSYNGTFQFTIGFQLDKVKP